MQKRTALYLLLLASGVSAAGDRFKPVYEIAEDKIVVWRFFPRTPCTIYSAEPTCPREQGIPITANGACTDIAVCNDVNAAALLPRGKKIVATHFYAAGGNRIRSDPGGPGWTECTSDGTCSIGKCKWERMRAGFGNFKNWSDNRDRTAAVLIEITPNRTSGKQK